MAITPEDLVRILRDNEDLRRENGGLVGGHLPPAATQTVSAARPPTPSEDAEQAAVVAWAQACVAQWPALAWLFHVPNGGARDAVTGAMLKRAGVRAGVPDLFLPCPRPRPDGGQWHGLFVEMKRADHSNSPSAEQKRWLDYLRSVGYMAVVCYGADEAIRAIGTYLGGAE